MPLAPRLLCLYLMGVDQQAFKLTGKVYYICYTVGLGSIRQSQPVRGMNACIVVFGGMNALAPDKIVKWIVGGD